MREAFQVDVSKLNFRGALVGTIALGLVIVFIGVFGQVTVAAGVAAVFVVAGGPSETRRPDRYSVLLVLAGALVTVIVSLSASSAIAATLAITLITFGATLLALLGKRARTTGVFGVMWAVLALAIGSTPEIALSLSVAFTVGGLVALAVLWLASRIPDRSSHADDDADSGRLPSGEPPLEEPSPDEPDPLLPGPARRTVINYAILRSLGVGACVFLGYQWFPDHSAWAALTFVLIVRPPAHQSFVAGVARAIGTGLGVGLATSIVHIDPGSQAIQIAAFVVAAYMMLATAKVNYAIFTMFTTVMLLLSQEQVEATGRQRLLATLLGVGVGFFVILIIVTLAKKREQYSAPH